jgi:hypothetical protein
MTAAVKDSHLLKTNIFCIFNMTGEVRTNVN